jgi:hypothetical protein
MRSTIYFVAFGVLCILHAAFALALLWLPVKLLGFEDFIGLVFGFGGGSVLGDILIYIVAFLTSCVYVGIFVKFIFVPSWRIIFYPLGQWLGVFSKDHYPTRDSLTIPKKNQPKPLKQKKQKKQKKRNRNQRKRVRRSRKSKPNR